MWLADRDFARNLKRQVTRERRRLKNARTGIAPSAGPPHIRRKGGGNAPRNDLHMKENDAPEPTDETDTSEPMAA